jgi:hypothetical protein
LRKKKSWRRKERVLLHLSSVLSCKRSGVAADWNFIDLDNFWDQFIVFLYRMYRRYFSLK